MWDRIFDIMQRPYHGLLLAILLLLTSCTQAEPPVTTTPTPFGAESQRFRNPATEPISISLTHLAANPEFFEGSTLLLSGEYRRLPVLACESDPHPGPAAWGIVSEGLMASASGHDEQLKTLLVENQPITIEGRWLRFVGPIGCGKSAPVEELWYLSVNRVVEPHPLARVTEPPIVQDGEPTIIAALPEPTIEPLQTVETPPTNPPGDSAINVTNTPELLPTPTIEPTLSPTTPPITGTVTVSVPTITVTATVETGTGTPGPTPSPTATRQEQAVDNKGSLDFEDLTIETLESGKTDRWTLPIDSSESITVSVAPGNNANIAITVLDETGATIIDAQDQAPAMEVEAINALDLADPGVYQILVSNSNTTEADYAIMVLSSESYSFIFQGTLIPSSPRSDSLNPENDHFWFFPLSEGDVINIRVTPNGQTDPYLELFDSRGSRVLTVDDTGTGETELLEEYEAPADGLYAIRVGEFDFASMSYQILLTES